MGGDGPFEGRVEILGPNGTWGIVCNRGWGDKDAGVVCRSAGYDGGREENRERFTVGDGPIWLDRIVCQGSEAQIAECDHAGWGNHECTQHDYAAVHCTGEGPGNRKKDDEDHNDVETSEAEQPDANDDVAGDEDNTTVQDSNATDEEASVAGDSNNADAAEVEDDTEITQKSDDAQSDNQEGVPQDMTLTENSSEDMTENSTEDTTESSTEDTTEDMTEDTTEDSTDNISEDEVTEINKSNKDGISIEHVESISIDNVKSLNSETSEDGNAILNAIKAYDDKNRHLHDNNTGSPFVADVIKMVSNDSSSLFYSTRNGIGWLTWTLICIFLLHLA